MSVTDDVYSQVAGKLESGISQGASVVLRNTANIANASKNVASSAAKGAFSGIVLIFNAPRFTAEAIMNAIGKMSNNPDISSNNVSIADLQKNSDIKSIDTQMTKNEMKFFDKGCKKYGVTYTAVVDKSNSKDPTYYVFFKGKETPVIEQVMKEAYQAFMKEQAHPKFSVRAKLAFFRDRVTARDAQQQELGQEKHNYRSEQQR